MIISKVACPLYSERKSTATVIEVLDKTNKDNVIKNIFDTFGDGF